MRRVLYDAPSRAAAAAAELLRDEFDVAPLSVPAASPAAGPAVVLVGPDSAGRHWGDAPFRVVALVAPDAAGPWPAHWYALLPAGVGVPILARAVANAFADLDRAAAMTRLDRELSELNAIGIRLSAERNPRDLIETILTKAREITRSDAGSLYLVEEDADGARSLRFALAQCDSMEVPFRASRLPLTDASVAGPVALTREIPNPADADIPPARAALHVNPAVDDEAHHPTKAMLVLPMHTPQGETIGALQLLNCKP